MTVPRAIPRLALLVGALFWVWLAIGVHTMPVSGGELDNYTTRAGSLLQGKLLPDRLHPFGLPLLIAGLGWFGMDLFLAGRLLGVAFALLLVGCTYRLARTWTSRLGATLTAVAVGSSEHVLVGAVQACSDVPAAACLALALLAATRAAAVVRPARRWLLLGGFAFGFAASLRTPAMALLPAFLPLLLGVSWRQRASTIGWSTVGGGLGLAPHLATLWLSGGSLFQNSSQIVWKYRYQHDDVAFLRYLGAPEPVAWSELLEWWRLGCLDWLGYLSHGLGQPWCLEGVGVIAIGTSLCMTLALLLPLLARHRAASVLALAAIAYSFALGVFSLPESRLTIPMAMPAVVLMTLAWARLPDRWRSLPVLLAAAMAASSLAKVPRALARFETVHAWEEMATARQLIAEHGEWISIALPSICVDAQLPCLFAPFAPVATLADAEASCWGRLLANPAARGAEFVIVNRRTWPSVHAEMSAVPPANGYELRRNGDVLVFARRHPEQWFDHTRAEVLGGDIRLELRLAASIDRATVASVGFLVRIGASNWEQLPLPPANDGLYTMTLPNRGVPPHTRLFFVPGFITWHGVVHSGRAITIEMPGAADAGR